LIDIPFIPVANNEGFLRYFPLLEKLFNYLNIIGLGGFQVNLVFQDFLQHERKMGALRAVTVSISTFVIGFSHSYLENFPGLFNLGTDFWEVGYFQRSSVLLDYPHQGNIVEIELVINHMELLLRKMKGLGY
jgi:hypothetical protein